MNIFENVIKDIQFIDGSKFNDYVKRNNIIARAEIKENNPIYEYLKKILISNYPQNSKEEYLCFIVQFEKKNENYIIFLNTELMDVYTKNLENLKRNLLNDNYSIPISYKSE